MKILIIEDEYNLADAISSMLKSKKYSVLIKTDGEEGLEETLRLMKSVGLKENYAKRKVLRISGGEQQRVAIARSLSYNPKMIVADEPTGNLDKQTEKDILDIFKKLAHEDGKCVIIVTHSPNICEMVDQVYDLKKVK